MAINEKYSYKSWKRQSFTEKDPVEFSNSTIRASCFAQKDPWTKIFPDGMTGVEFYECNLDNCVIPPGNTLTKCTNKHWKEMADGEQWIVDKSLNPIEPMKPWLFDRWELSKDPAMIATQAQIRVQVTATKSRSITQQKAWNQENALKELRADEATLIQYLKDTGKL